MTGPDLRARATVTCYEPPLYDLEKPLWVAEDPETDCVGIGRVEAEAFGNLTAAVAEFEADGGRVPYKKLPGRTIRREAGGGLLEKLRERFGRG
ncbi:MULTISPECIES: hypothetical protein [unclassified Haladaptatus]|uniref:hypothetical protein n=1 Tax=unclassified Haladaptatus TaxID=2622732 RepID=UPI0023E7CBAF|nr:MULTISPECIES: hypothetical protein [unclassified Haladaptatus]